MIEIVGKHTTAKVMIDSFDDTSSKQIHNFVNNDSFTNPVAIMPDCHAGKGAVIGFTMKLTDRVIPSVVGVDIACGMYAVKTKLQSLFSFDDVDRLVRANVPMSNNVRKKNIVNVEKQFDWPAIQKDAVIFSNKFNTIYGTDYKCPVIDYKAFLNLCSTVGIDHEYAEASVGSLGSGNHFIEIGIDEEGYHWITIHSGSRNLGLKTATYWQAKAVDVRKKDISVKVVEEIKATYPKKEWDNRIKEIKQGGKVQTGLEYLTGLDMYNYLIDSIIVYHYAKSNREVIMVHVLEAFKMNGVLDSITTTHNYIDHRDFIIRKGAVASYKNERMVIPFNMEDGLLICEGKSNPEWNFSAPHGAGRSHSRTTAKEKLSIKDAVDRMHDKAIYSSVIPLDETMQAYKPAKMIEEAIGPTATILHRVKPIMNFKAK